MLNTKMWKMLGFPVGGAALLMVMGAVYSPSSYAQKSSPVLIAQGLNTTYTLGGGDRIKITVLDVPEYSGDYTIPPGGTVNLPLIGSVSLQGLSTEQAADLIERRYSRFLKRPITSVNLLAPRPINVVVSGEVTRPDAYTLSLQGGAGDNPGVQYPTVLSALRNAQGVTFAANIERVQLRRRGQRSGTVINLKQIIQQGNSPVDITLRDGDTIFVPTGAGINLNEVRQLSYAGIAPDPTRPRTVAVIGEVSSPGSYLITTGAAAENANNGGATNSGLPNISRAIQQAGGITALADISRVQLRRRTRNGTTQTVTVNLRQLLQGDINQDTLLQDGDTIVIPEGGSINLADARLLSQVNLAQSANRPRSVAIIGEVTRPGSYLITSGNDNTPGGNGASGFPNITKAIQQAGGLTSLADISNVKLQRRTKSGTLRVVNINLRQLLKGDVNQDALLQDGDTITIPEGGSVNLADARLLSQVNLAQSTTTPRSVAVIGEVSRPGSYLITSGNDNSPGGGGASGFPNVTKAIQQAGGLTALADITNVKLERRSKNGGVRVISINLRQLLRGDVNQDTLLQDGDTITISSGSSLNLADARLLSQVNLAQSSTAPRSVAVIGEVFRPGSYLITSGNENNPGGGNAASGFPNITKAIQQAGGLTALANIRDIQLKRRAKDGSEKFVKINLWELLQGDVNQDTLLQDGDTVVIPKGPSINLAEARFLSQVNLAQDPTKPRNVAVVGEVGRPGTYSVSAGNTAEGPQGANIGGGGGLPSVTRAIQLAGGITPQANIAGVKIRRPVRDGSGKEEIIDVNLWNVIRSGDLSQDVLLQEGDTIFIPVATETIAAEATQLATTTLAPGRIQVSVVGEVKKPGLTDLQPNSPLNAAILAAGGFNDARANTKTVDLVRLNPDGSVTKRAIKVNFGKGINEDTNPILRNNDIILINRSTLAEVADPATTVINPISGAINIIRFLFGGF
jgi:polysaccharide biosynthesis/export protein